MEHIVNFSQYCSTCEHFELDGTEEPCNECLSEPITRDTQKPVNYEEKKDES